MLKYASLTLSRGYNIEKGRGGRKVKIWDWKTHAFNETGLFQGVSQLLLSMIVYSQNKPFTPWQIHIKSHSYTSFWLLVIVHNEIFHFITVLHACLNNSSLVLATCTFKTLRFSSISCRWQSKGLFSAFFGAVNFCSCEMRVRCWCERQMLRLLWLEFVRSWRTRHFHVHSSHFSR